METRKMTMYHKLASALVDKVASDDLPINLIIGESYYDEMQDKQTDILLECEDKQLLNETINSIINTVIL